MSDTKRGRLRWKKNAPPRGLARVGYGAIGSKLTDGIDEYASVAELKGRHRNGGWYWVAPTSARVSYKNTCDEPCATEQEAKAQAESYIREQLNKEPT